MRGGGSGAAHVAEDVDGSDDAEAAGGSEGARERLLRGARRLLLDRGRLSDLSLRAMADLLGTSHRMLIYHFGSRDGLLAALLVDLGRRERAMLRERNGRGGVLDALHLLESAYLDDANGPRSAAFFYVLGLAAQDPETYREFLESIDAWVELFTVLGEREGHSPEAAHARAHALVWAARGAMFEALADGRREAALRGFRSVVAQLGYSIE